MISFALVFVSLQTVALAALVGMLVGLVLHYAHRYFCKYNGVYCNNKQGCSSGERHCGEKGMSGERAVHAERGLHADKYEEGYPSIEKQDEYDYPCDFTCIALYKLVAYVLAFIQAYGVAFLLERFDLLDNYQDAIWLTLFVALTFVVTKLFACTAWHHKAYMHFLAKVACCFAVFATMAAVIVYLS